MQRGGFSPLPSEFRDEAARSQDSVLLETSRFDASNHNSYLFLNPIRLLVAKRLEEIPKLFADIETALDQGQWLAGYLAYECGYHFQGLPGGTLSQPLAWFGVYEQVKIHDHLRPGPGRAQPRDDDQSPIRGAIATGAGMEISKQAYVAAIAKIKEHLAAGDSYQVNFTDRLAFVTTFSASQLFSTLSAHQRVAYSAFLNIASCPIVSLSPELFFATDGDRIVTRPMKGTMPRGLDLTDDHRMANLLRNDAKNRSEHVMIVDLLRNDLGRICRAGSVQVQSPFSIERYETLHQMTSTVEGRLQSGATFYDVFRGLFPSGSITGAPKHRTMQIIHDLERGSRGVYTGAIGFISPKRSSVFNVAIRTLVVQDHHVTMGVGGGIVADSQPEDEYRECLLKAAFVTRPNQPFQLIETMLWDGEYKLLSFHLDRMESSAGYFEFSFDRSRVTSELLGLSRSAAFVPGERRRIRLTLSASGKTAMEASSLADAGSDIRVWLTHEHTSSSDAFRRHKTTRRELYDRLYAKARAHGFADVIFTNEHGAVTEGAVSNVFIEVAGEWLTPPVSSGLLPGVLRRHILETRAGAREAPLTVADLRSAEAVYLCSSLRGLRRVTSFNELL